MIKLLHNDKNEKLPTVKNVGKEATDEIYMSPTVKVLKSEKDAWNYAGEEGIAEHSIMSGEVDYLEPNGKGKSFYNIGSIKPGQTMTINLGYFVDEDKMDSIFLDAFHYTGSGETEEELEIFISGLANGLSQDNASLIKHLPNGEFYMTKDANQTYNLSKINHTTQEKLLNTEKDALALSIQMGFLNDVDGKQRSVSFVTATDSKFFPEVSAGEIILDSSMKEKGIQVGDKLTNNQYSGEFIVKGFVEQSKGAPKKTMMNFNQTGMRSHHGGGGYASGGHGGNANWHQHGGGNPNWGHGGNWHHQGGYYPGGGFALGTLTGLALGAAATPAPYPVPTPYPYSYPYPSPYPYPYITPYYPGY